MDKILPNEMAIELAGPGITPSTVDAAALLGLAHAYVDLLIALAASSGDVLSFCGVRVVEKCAAVVLPPNDRAVARDAAKVANDVVSGKRAAPRGTETRAKALSRSLEALPAGYRAQARLGRTSWSLVPPMPVERAPRPWSLSSVRVKVVELHPTPARARFSCAWLEDFSLQATPALVRTLGAHLYEEIDIDVRWTFDENDKVEAGEVIDVHPLSTEDALSAWQRWYGDAATTTEAGVDRRRPD